MEFLREQTLGGVAEFMEALNESGWRSWKQKGFGETDVQRTSDELSDVLIFLTNIALVSGISPDQLEESLRDTIKKNDARLDSGY